MKLLEIFNSSYSYSWILYPEIYNMEAMANFVDDENNKHDVRFAPSGTHTNEDFIEIIWTNHEYGENLIKNTGVSQYKIFSTILDIIGEYISEVNPKKMQVSVEKINSADPNNSPDDWYKSREKLYRTMAKKFSSSYGFSYNENEYKDKLIFEFIKN